ncbi:AAA family ATPase [Nonomuraea sp. MCN248]|uniref:AAA family ATPase n=1 Tax=Nonomuraea corallina TaxID=2989783 RepID=A0ABT4SLH7_9ACTN|nr:AAA family ATPase [Nonomuraea corallina]MDA0638093.1 AAA family ATPase [Nonomuraea corallina]
MAPDDARQDAVLLMDLLREATAGRGRIAMVTGAVATGKSELLHDFADRALDQGALPLSATGSRAERDLPFGVLSQLAQNAPTAEHRAATLELLREGARPPAPGAQSFEPVNARLVDALCAVLRELSERRPLVIAVDDVHHADHASQLCLSYLARRVKYARILLVLSAPDHGAHPQDVLRTEVQRQPHCRQVRLAHLSAEGVAARVRERAGGQAAGFFATRCHELSGGNRLLVDAALEDLGATGEPGERYAEAVLACLQRADPGLLPMARALAVMGEPGAAGRLLGQGEAAAARAVRAMTGAGLLAGGRFRHQVAASAVLAGLDGGELAALHRQAAELTYLESAPAAVVAGHLLRTGHAGDPWALSVLEEAAKQALRDDGVEPAIEYLTLAWQECHDERRRARIATTLVRAKWRIDPGTPIGHLAELTELTEALRHGHLGGGDAIVLARALLWHGHAAEARDVLSRLGDREELDREAVVELEAARAWLRSSWPAFLPHLPEPMPEQASAVARSLGGDRRLESADALASTLREGPQEELVTAAERILRGSRLDEMSMDTVECALLTLIYSDRADRAVSWCDAFVAEAADRHAPSRQARLSAIRAEIALRRGDLAAAARDAQRALELISPESWGVAIGAPLGILLIAGAAMGRHPDYLTQAALPVPEAMLETRFAAQYLYGKGRFALMSGQPRRALRDLRMCGELTEAWGLDVPEFVPWRLDAAEALIRLGEAEEARGLIEAQLAGCGKRSKRVHGMALRLLAAAGEVRHRVMLLRRAADLLQAGGDRYEHARALVDLTEAYHAIGEHRRAGMLGGRAGALARECHADSLLRSPSRGAAAVTSSARHHGRVGHGRSADGTRNGTPEAAATLSEAEHRVAALAAEGYSNREISGKLFITVSTVEQHLTRIYRKLDVSRRRDLPAGLSGRA